MQERDLEKLLLANKIFPFDFRFRVSASQLYINSIEDRKTIEILNKLQRIEYTSPNVMAGFILHNIRINDTENASIQFKKLYDICPQCKFIKMILASRRDP